MKRLSRIYLDNSPVTLAGDESAPPLSRIIQAGGKRPDSFDIRLLASRSDQQGRPVGLDEIIDRAAEPTRPIYLRAIPHDVKAIYTTGTGARPPHEEAVFRAPSQFPQTQARAEAEAEQRQEDERNHEDALQDETEAAQDADSDAETHS